MQDSHFLKRAPLFTICQKLTAKKYPVARRIISRRRTCGTTGVRGAVNSFASGTMLIQ